MSTQNTLASVESGSISTPRACVDRLGQQQPPAPQVETAPGPSGLGLLTTITERRSPAPSRSTSNIRTSRRTISSSSSTGQGTGDSIRRGEPVEGRALLQSAAREIPEDQAPPPQDATLRRLRTIGRRFKRHFSAKPRDFWKLPRIVVRRPTTSASRVDVADPPSASAPTTEVSSNQEQPVNAEPFVIGTGDDPEDRHAPLRARRRELTLARERELAPLPKCECGPECPCISGSRLAQASRADTPDIPVPSYLFGAYHSSTGSSNSRPSQNSAQGVDPLVHIGDIFESTRRSSSADESSSAADSVSRRVRLSQGSTLWSNGSSVSLRSRRPLVNRASSMPVGTRAQYLAGVRNGSQSITLNPGSSWSETGRTPTSLDDGSLPRRTRHAEPSGDIEDSSHESSTSLANLPDSQEEEELVDGMSSRSHTSLPDVDEVTPTPRSGIRINGNSNGVLPVGSGGLSSALQDLADGDMTDHEAEVSGSQPNDAFD